MKKGIDISYCQKGLNLRDAKNQGVEYVVIRAGCAESIDSQFETHTKGAVDTGLPYGFYWYSGAFSTVDAEKEANACLNVIHRYTPTYPVYYDMEQQDQINKLDNATRTAIITTFCDIIRKKGYTAGVYLNPTWLENYVDKKILLDKYDLWLACWTNNPDIQPKYQYGQKMWQWGSIRSAAWMLMGISATLIINEPVPVFQTFLSKNGGYLMSQPVVQNQKGLHLKCLDEPFLRVRKPLISSGFADFFRGPEEMPGELIPALSIHPPLQPAARKAQGGFPPVPSD